MNGIRKGTYIIKDFYKNGRTSIMNIVNIFIILYSSILLFNSLSSIITAHYVIKNNGEKYYNQYSLIRTSEDKNYNYNTIYDEGNLEIFKKFFDYIDANFNASVIIPNLSIEINEDSIIEKNLYLVNNNFIKDTLSKNIKVSLHNDLKTTYIPIILGATYEKYYNLGEIIDNKYCVLGILKKNAKYFNFRRGYNSISLDNKVFTPINSNDLDVFYYSVLIEQMLFSTDKIDNLYKINNKASELKLDRFRFINQVDSFYNCLKDDMGYLNYQLFFQLNILCLAFISSICILIKNLELRKNEFYVNIICGATKKAILSRVYINNLFTTVLALILSSISSLIILQLTLSKLIIPVIFILTIYLGILNSISKIYISKFNFFK